VVIPFRASFLKYEFNTLIGFLVTDIIVDCLLVIDLIFQTFIPFHDTNGDYQTSYYKTSFNYLKTWFIIDVISVLPIDYALIVPFPQYVQFFRLNRLLRMARYNVYWKQFEDFMSNMSSGSLRIINLILILSYIVHIGSCLFNGVILVGDPLFADMFTSVNNYVNKPIVTSYIYSFYWVLSTMVGYGGTSPITFAQYVFGSAVVVVGIVMNILLFGLVGSLITNLGETESKQQQKIEEVKEYMRYRKLPEDIQEKVLNYYTFMARSRKGWDEQKILDDMPSYLKTEVALSANRKLIEKVPMFKVEGVNKMFISSVVVRLIPRVCLPGALIVEKGDVGREMFFIASGFVEIVSEDLKVVYVTLPEGSFFGEIALIFDTTRTATIRAGTFCDLYILTKDSFDEISLDYPDQIDAIKIAAEKRRADAAKKAEEDKKKKEEEANKKAAEEEAKKKAAEGGETQTPAAPQTPAPTPAPSK